MINSYSCRLPPSLPVLPWPFFWSYGKMVHYKLLSRDNITTNDFFTKVDTPQKLFLSRWLSVAQCPSDSKIHSAYGWNWREQNTREENPLERLAILQLGLWIYFSSIGQKNKEVNTEMLNTTFWDIVSPHPLQLYRTTQIFRFWRPSIEKGCLSKEKKKKGLNSHAMAWCNVERGG